MLKTQYEVRAFKVHPCKAYYRKGTNTHKLSERKGDFKRAQSQPNTDPTDLNERSVRPRVRALEIPPIPLYHDVQILREKHITNAYQNKNERMHSILEGLKERAF